MLTQGVWLRAMHWFQLPARPRRSLLMPDPAVRPSMARTRGDGFVVRTIIGDQEVERTAVLVQNGVQRLGEMHRAVARGNGDGEQGGGARKGRNGLSSCLDLIGSSRRDSQVKSPDEWPSFQASWTA